ncbi:MAG: SMC-Scp complex subunit ScpB [Pseudomonadota bacterium]
MTDEQDAIDAGPATTEGAPAATIARLPSADRGQDLRVIEARLFATDTPLSVEALAETLPVDADVPALLEELKGLYAGRGVNLVEVAGGWAFRTAEDLSHLLERHMQAERRLSKAALETLSIIAYHQPATRAEIEEIRGVATSKGTLDVLMDVGWIRPRGRRRAPGRPVTYGTTQEFLAHFSLASLRDLPGIGELKGAGLLNPNLPPDFKVPEPTDMAALMPDELPLEDGEDETADLFAPEDDADHDYDHDHDHDRDEDALDLEEADGDERTSRRSARSTAETGASGEL